MKRRHLAFKSKYLYIFQVGLVGCHPGDRSPVRKAWMLHHLPKTDFFYNWVT